MKKELTVVGIGASAGGLEALKDFFTNLPDHTGLSFVVVQHLSPDFKSLMDELLAKYTNMPIHKVNVDMELLPNHIYLISHDKNIIIKEGWVRNTERKPSGVLNLPIDEFFHSLGKEKGNRAIGIILSGTGTDGSRGVKTIKEKGGLVMVQDTVSAKFDGMPLAAISLGLADNILDPAELAQELARISDTGGVATVKPFVSNDKESYKVILDKVLACVTVVAGVNFAEYRRATLIRRLEKRMFVKNINSLYEYYLYILKHEEEAKLLFKEFLIGVTLFFRDPDAYSIIEDIVIPSIFRGKEPTQTIRIWTVACSTGEEAYSLAMLISEYIEDNNLKFQFKIFATDVDKDAIAYGSEGIYHDNIIADVGTERIERFFNKVDTNKLQVKKSLRQHIVFAVHDSMQDPPFINTDLISCRNMLIYINTPIQKSLLSNFQFALNQGGYLFLGPSESIGDLKKAFAPVSQKWNIYQNVLKGKMLPVTRARREVEPISKQRTIEENPIKKVKTINTPDIKNIDYKLYDEFFARLLVQKHAPSCLFVNEDLDIFYMNGSFEDLLLFPQAVVKWNLQNMVGDDELMLIKNGIQKAIELEKMITFKDVLYTKRNKTTQLTLTIQRFKSQELNQVFFLIEFYIQGNSQVKLSGEVEVIDLKQYKDDRLKMVEVELWETKRERQQLIGQLETINEELQSSNEELLASNEELQSTNEELQSVNEEIFTVNTELQMKIGELTTANSDINNLLKSTQIGTVFLDGAMNIRKYTPQIQKQFNFVENDIGRSITTFRNPFDDDEIYTDIKRLMKDITIDKVERQVLHEDGTAYLMRILPYRTDMEEIDGTVLSFINIEALIQAKRQISISAKRYEIILDHVDIQVTFVDRDFRIESINHSLSGRTEKELIGTSILDIIEPASANDKMRAAVNKCFKAGIMTEFDWTYAPEDRTHLSLHTKIIPVDVNGERPLVALITELLDS